jgi:DNA gyrase/topoisomerase IV subunit B
MKFYKGLSTWSTKQFGEFLSNLENYLFKVNMEDQADKEAIDLAFNSARADDRKKWLETPAGDFEDYIIQE